VDVANNLPEDSRISLKLFSHSCLFTDRISDHSGAKSRSERTDCYRH